jgi:hypothetical protein
MIERLRHSDETRACEIVDIQFAMSDYQYLESVVNIKKISQEIEKIDLQMKECSPGSWKHGKLEDQRFMHLQGIDNHKI